MGRAGDGAGRHGLALLHDSLPDGRGPAAGRPDLRVAVEVQSVRWHGAPQRSAADRRRLLGLASLGWDVVEVTPGMLCDDGGPEAPVVVRALTRACARVS